MINSVKCLGEVKVNNICLDVFIQVSANGMKNG